MGVLNYEFEPNPTPPKSVFLVKSLSSQTYDNFFHTIVIFTKYNITWVRWQKFVDEVMNFYHDVINFISK